MKSTTARCLAAVLVPSFVAGASACSNNEPVIPEPEAVTPINTPPIAAAGSDQTLPEASRVTLDATASHDVEGKIAAYAWTQLSGDSVHLSGADAARATFDAPPVTGNNDNIDLVFEVTVTDGDGDTAKDSLAIRVYDNNQRPTAVIANAPASTDAATAIALDASGSTDAEGAVTGWEWRQTGGATARFDNPNVAVTTVTMPDVVQEETVILEVLVTDGENKVGSAKAFIRVFPKADSIGFIGLADPTNVEVDTIWPSLRLEVLTSSGTRITHDIPASANVTLEVNQGTGQLAGTLTRKANQGVVVFNDLAYDAVENGVILRAFISGGSASSSSPAINVVLTNPPPNVQASTPQPSVDALTSGVQLVGTITDDGSISDRTWTQLSGPTVTINDATLDVANFDAPDVAAPTDFLFQLSATDNGGKTTTDTVVVTVVPVAARVEFIAPLRPAVPAGGFWADVDVEILNSSNQHITGGGAATHTVHLALQTAAGVPADFTGTKDVVAVDGVASFADLTYAIPYSGVILVPSVATPALGGAPSTPVDVVGTLPGAIGGTGASIWTHAIIGASAGDVILVGGFSSATPGIDFGFARTGDIHTNVGVTDGFIARYQADGTQRWTATFGSAAVATDLVAAAPSETDDPLVLWHTDTQRLAQHGASDGQVLWDVSIGDTAEVTTRALAFRDGPPRRHGIVAGSFVGTGVVIEPCVGTATHSAATDTGFIAAIDIDTIGTSCAATAAETWFYAPSTTSGTSSFDAVVVDGAGAVFAAGTYTGTMEFVAGTPLTPTTGAVSHVVVVALDAGGAAQWAKSLGGDVGNTLVGGVALDAAGNLFVAGTFSGSNDFNPGGTPHILTAGGDAAGFVASLDAAGTLRPNLTFAFGGVAAGDAVLAGDIGVGPTAGDPILVSGAFWGDVDFDASGATAMRSARASESGGFVLAVANDGAFVDVYATGAASGAFGLDVQNGAIHVTHPIAGNVTVMVTGSAGGADAEADLDPTSAGVRRHRPFGDQDATLSLITP